MKFYEAWQYLENHPIFEDKMGFSEFTQCIDIEIVKVNPYTNSISDNTDENISTRVWLECGPYIGEKARAHDIELDCGAKTFEKAIKKLAKLVKKVYGDDRKNALNLVKEKYNTEE